MRKVLLTKPNDQNQTVPLSPVTESKKKKIKYQCINLTVLGYTNKTNFGSGQVMTLGNDCIFSLFTMNPSVFHS